MGLFSVEAPTVEAVYNRLHVYAPSLPEDSIPRVDAIRSRGPFAAIEADMTNVDRDAAMFRIAGRSLRGPKGIARGNLWAIVGRVVETPIETFDIVFPVSFDMYVRKQVLISSEQVENPDMPDLYLAAAATAICGYINGSHDTKQNELNITPQE